MRSPTSSLAPRLISSQADVKADVKINKRLLGGGRNGDILGNILVRLTKLGSLLISQEPVTGSYLEEYNPHDGRYPTGGLATADVKALVDVVDVKHNHKRNGLFHSAPGGTKVDGAVKVILQMLAVISS